MNRILLFSRPVRSAKTTELMASLPQLDHIGGILCPDKDDLLINDLNAWYKS